MRLRAPALALLASAALAAPAPAAWQKQPDGILVTTAATNVRLRVLADGAVRVVAWPAAKPEPDRPSLAVVATGKGVAFQASEAGGAVVLKTAKLAARVDAATGRVTFEDGRGGVLLRETAGGGRTFTPVTSYGVATMEVRQEFEAAAGESLYGLGQHQDRLLDIAGRDLDLWQHNREVVIPYVVSTRGWGLLWDNPAQTRFGHPEDIVPLPASAVADESGKKGSLTAAFFAGRDFTQPLATTAAPSADAVSLPADVAAKCLTARWTGSLVVPKTGEYGLYTAHVLGWVKLWVDGKELVDYWSPFLPATDVARVKLEAGRAHALKIEWKRQDAKSPFEMRWLPPRAAKPPISLWAGAAEGVDYVFVNGGSLAGAVAGYRELTGRASLPPKWALGYWQSRERYKTGDELVATVKEFRARRFPLDAIVQDWQYWPEGGTGWGSHEFDKTRFPDPKGTFDAVHALGARAMISVWSKFYTGNRNFDQLKAAGFLYPRNLELQWKDWLGNVFTHYDAFSPAARAMYWRQMNEQIFSKGVDAWWLDATEPDFVDDQKPEDLALRMNPTAAGPGVRVMNAFPLVTVQGVYEGQRQAAPDKRVTILTRSAWAGSQRYGAAVWSGDITAKWGVLKAQIPAGLSYSLSGMPWWATDIGAFNTDDQGGNASEAYRELYTRWFQFGTFSPLFRSHGSNTPREPWFFGAPDHKAWKTLVRFANLRYRLLPYNYTLAARVTREHDTILRPLVLDFPGDPKARDVKDQYLFGPAFLVSPVTEPGATSRSVYLPAGDWYDFWTGERVAGGRTIDAAAPYEKMPLFVRAGSIVPFGPELQWTGEKPADPVRLVVYTGRDGSFTLHEDDGETNAHETGAFSTIPLSWSEAKRTLTIGARSGEFAGMPKARTFEVVFASAARKAGDDAPPAADKVVRYDGAAVSVEAPRP
ncbi:MAG: glycoside hydrolase family 31 protein [Vicinamibacteria bacterium]